MNFDKKQLSVITCLLSVIVILLGIFAGILISRRYELNKERPQIVSAENTDGVSETTDNPAGTTETSGEAHDSITETAVEPEESGGSSVWSVESLKKGRVTAIEHEEVLVDNIVDAEAAKKCLSDYGDRQREKYDNPGVKLIEQRIQDKFGIFAVNFGEMEEETALDLEKALEYMYDRYPELNGNLTNITLANTDSFKTGHLAVTRCREYVINGEYTVCPYVVKHEIILSASAFLQRDELIKNVIRAWKKGIGLRG